MPHFFTVVENSNKETFCKAVSSLLEDGWQLHGAPTFVPGEDAEGNALVGVYVQALHKLETAFKPAAA